MRGIFVRMLITALAIGIASALVPSMEITGIGTLFAAAILLGIVNAIVRPLIILLTLPITIVTLGLFLLVINAAMLGLVAKLLDGLVLGGFWSAVFASILVSVVSWFASWTIGPGGRYELLSHRKND